ncbi:MAG: hypothetical protein R3F62_11715 [Planctomycetota bacterium]
MTIRIGGATQGATCVYCHDALGRVAVSCACGARYHEDCAAVFGACAIPGCGQSLAADLERWPLPRLGRLAQLLGQEFGNAQLSGSAAVVCLHAPPRAIANSPRAAQAVADVLGPQHTAFDARLRLNSQFPEPLVRTSSRMAADQVVAELARAGLSGQAVLLQDLLHPLQARDVEKVELLPDALACVDAQGVATTTPLDAPFLAMGASVFNVSRKHDTRITTSYSSSGGMHGGYRGTRATRSMHSREVLARDPGLFVYSPQDSTPTLLQRDALRTIRVGPETGLKSQNWLTLVKTLLRRADRAEEVSGAHSPALRAPSRPGFPEDKSNLLGLLLVGRLYWLQWTQGGRTGK